MPAQDVDPERDIIATTLEIESYSLFGCYLVAAIVVWFVYYHHPSHIGIMIRDSQFNEQNLGFNEDTTYTIWNSYAGRNINSTVG